MAVHLLHCSKMRTVKLPVPGPTSRTMSEDFKEALSTIAWATRGFFRMCWPRSAVLNCEARNVSEAMWRESHEDQFTKALRDPVDSALDVLALGAAADFAETLDNFSDVALGMVRARLGEEEKKIRNKGRRMCSRSRVKCYMEVFYMMCFL